MTFFCSSFDFRPQNWTSADVLTIFFAFHLTWGGKRTASNCGPWLGRVGIGGLVSGELRLVSGKFGIGRVGDGGPGL